MGFSALLNSRVAYGLVAQLLHWITAALILSLIPIGIYMSDLPAETAAAAAHKSWMYSLHKTLGITVFVVSIVRVGWAMFQPRPQLLNAARPLESFAAHTVHWTLYGTLILLPVTGWLYHSASEGFAPIWWPLLQDLAFIPKDPGLAEIFQTAHFFTAYLMIISLILHIGAAVKHTVIDRDATLRRMIPGMYHAPERTVPESATYRLPVMVSGAVFILLGIVIATAVRTDVTSVQQHTSSVLGAATKSDVSWRVDAKRSRLSIEVKIMGNPVAGHFENWTTDIKFDPQNPSTASISATIDVSSLVLGSVKTQALSVDFLNAAKHPTATFVSTSIIRVEESRYEAKGELSLAGLKKAVTMSFDLSVTGKDAVVDGVVNLDRLSFGIGQKGFPDSAVLDAKVPVRLKLEARKKP